MIFHALNQLEIDLQLGGNSSEKKDEIQIKYDRNTEGKISEIPSLCQEGLTDFPNWSVAYQEDATEKRYEKQLNEKKYKEQINGLIVGQENIDYQFMINNYVYLYLFFKSIITEEKTPGSYLGYLKKETREGVDYPSSRLTALRDIFKYEVTVIWYEPEGEDEENTFEKFNAGKIALTKSELVKALFMNPDNFIAAGQNDYSNEAIKVRQIMIGVEWDSIERQLYHADLWFFIPHCEEHNNNNRIDALIDMLVYFEYRKNSENSEKGASKKDLQKKYEDSLFSFKELEKWIKDDLKEETTSEGKTTVMKKWWEKIKNLYEWYSDIFDATDYHSNSEEASVSYEIFHRISLIQMMQELYFSNITNGNQDERYIEALEVNYTIFSALSKIGAGGFKNKLNEIIKEKIDTIWKNDNTSVADNVSKEKCVSLDKKIRALNYAEGKKRILMRIFLVILSLDIQEKTVGSISRFSFKEFARKDKNKEDDWILEHVFAKGTNFGKLSGEKKIELLHKLLRYEWKPYIRYRYEGILDEAEIERIITVKAKLQSQIKQLVANPAEIPAKVWAETDTGYEADAREMPDDMYQSLAVNFLKDNSMGNMGLITRTVNSSVGNNSFTQKQTKIRERASEGKFIPVGTSNLFNGVYSNKSFDMDYWYPVHRIEYLKQLIKSIENYLA